MNQTEIMKEPRDCFAVLQLFPEPYRQKVRTALESAGGSGVPDRQPLSIGGASHSRQRYTCGLQEIRFRIGRPVLFYIDGEEWFATEDGSLQKTLQPTLQWIASRKEILQIIQHICRYSMYAYEEELGKGFISTAFGCRVGVAGEVLMGTDGSVKNIRCISSLNIRVAHEAKGIAGAVLPYLYEEKKLCSTLLISPPGCGKTTLLRDIIRMVSDGNRLAGGMTVGVVDERSELAGCCDGIAVNDLGMRTDILDGCLKAAGMLMLLRSMAPDVVAVDELGDREDTTALEQVLKCGCSVLATVHGGSYEELSRKRFLQPLLQAGAFQRYLVLKHCDGTFFVEQVRDGDGQLLASGLGMLRLIGICLTLAGSFGSGLAFCREKSRHAGTLFLLAELFLRMAEEIGYSAERLPDVFSQMSVWLAKDAENDSFGKEEASALAEALLHCADRLEQERSEPLEVVWNAELGAWAAQTVLSREEAEKLLSFAKEQGFPDRERQRQWMLRLSGEFKSRAESVFEKAASEKRMVLSVSLAAGALVVVLFW